MSEEHLHPTIEAKIAQMVNNLDDDGVEMMIEYIRKITKKPKVLVARGTYELILSEIANIIVRVPKDFTNFGTSESNDED